MLKKFAATSVLGLAMTGAVLSGAPAASAGTHDHGRGGMYTSGRGGILSGIQIFAPIFIPIHVGCNAIAVLGKARAC